MDSITPARAKREQATWSAYGNITTDARRYRPLDTVTIHIRGRQQGDRQALIRVCDSNQKTYFEAQVMLQDNLGTMPFKAAGALGPHYIYLFWPAEVQHSRYLNFLVACETAIDSGDADFDDIYPLSHELMLLGRREYQLPDGKFVGYISYHMNIDYSITTLTLDFSGSGQQATTLTNFITRGNNDNHKGPTPPRTTPCRYAATRAMNFVRVLPSTFCCPRTGNP